MERANLIKLIGETFEQVAEAQGQVVDQQIDETTRLYGKGGYFDSLGLVSVILELEQEINVQMDSTIAIADERAMSQSNSPFRSVGSLADYVLMLLQERQAA